MIDPSRVEILSGGIVTILLATLSVSAKKKYPFFLFRHI